MNLSRLAVLAVFFMMVMSAFVTIPTYNVGADEHEDGGDDHGDECPFDEDNPDSPCNVQECEDHESQECKDYVENYCANNDDPGCNSMNDMVCYDIEEHEIKRNDRNIYFKIFTIISNEAQIYKFIGH